VSSVTFTASSIPVGATTQGTVTLSTAAGAGGATVSLTSSSGAVTVPPTITIASGAMAATFTASGASAGSAVITASLNGNSRQSSPLTVSGVAVAIRSITLSASTVTGGGLVTATASLTGPAPSSGATITLTATDPITVPASVTVPAGEITAVFTAMTRPVTDTVTGTITGAYGGATTSAALAVTKVTAAIARFGVTGSTESETCRLLNSGTSIECVFDGSTSTSPGRIVEWQWTWGVSGSRSQTTATATLERPSFDCSMMPAAPLPAGTSWLALSVTLVVRDDRGNVSDPAMNRDVRLFPQGSCGY
jgi:hypothetical protein